MGKMLQQGKWAMLMLALAVWCTGCSDDDSSAPSYAAKLYHYDNVYIYVQGNYIFKKKGEPPYNEIDPFIIEFREKGGKVNWGMFFAYFKNFGIKSYPTSGEDLCQAENGNYWLRFPEACTSVQGLGEVGFTIGGNGGGWGKVPIGADESEDDASALVMRKKALWGPL